MQVLSHSFQNSDLIFTLFFKTIYKSTALVSELPSPSALRRETVSGRDEALLPTGFQPGLETEHTRLRMWGLGMGHHPISVGLWDRPGGVGGYRLQISRPHPDTWNQPPGVGPGIPFVSSSQQPGLLRLPTGPCASLESHGPVWVLHPVTGHSSVGAEV